MIGSAKTHLFAALCLAASAHHALADDNEIDVKSFEYVDVIETADGSVWKGVVVEQTPNVQYKVATADGSLHVIKAADVAKMSKQKNREWRGGVAVAGTSTSTSTSGGADLTGHYEAGGGLPAPYATSGMRVDVGEITVIPQGDIGMMNTSFSPNVTAGYEHLFGNFGLGGGGLARFTYWRLPDGENPDDAAWTLETHAYVRAALHLGRVALYGGGSLGLDTNMVHVGMLNMSKNTTGFGMNAQAGAEIAATPNLAFKVSFDYHPGTDTVIDGSPASIEYLGLGLGATLRM